MVVEPIAVLITEPLMLQEIERRDKILIWDKAAKKLALGQHTCRDGWKDFGSALGEQTCESYHAGFNEWVLKGLVSSPGFHREHYEGVMRMATSKEGSHKILISGTATPELPEMALEASGSDTQVTVLDICPTPLLTCQQVFTKAQLARMEFVQANILKYAAPDNEFDVVAADALVSRFKDGDQEKVLANWARMLKPSGVAVTTLRFGPKLDQTGYGDQAARDIFLQNVLAQSQRLGVAPQNLLEFETMVDLAQQYSSNMHSNHPESIEAIKALMGKFFKDVRIESSLPYRFYDVTMRPYARILGYDPIKS